MMDFLGGNGAKGKVGEALRRDAFVAAMLRWLGVIRPKDVALVFGVSEMTAARVLADWARRHPGMTSHRRGEHGYRWSGPQSIERESGNVLLAYMRGQALSDRYMSGLGAGLGVDVEDADAIVEPPIDSQILTLVLRSVREQQALAIRYMGREAAADAVVSPIRLVHALGRYHVRCLDHRDDIFKDFVLSRILGVAATSEERRSMPDREWENGVSLKFRINPALPPAMAASVTNEWGVDNDGVHTIRCRIAIARYVVRRMTMLTIDGIPRWVAENDQTAKYAAKA
jgi:hypothetical protein